MKSLRKKKVLSLIGALVFVFLFLQRGSISSFARDRYEDLQLFAQVLNLVQQYYVEEVPTKKLIYGGIKGMLKELDPHTNFLPPEVFKEFRSETRGEFGGLGIEITIKKGVLTIISPIEDAPAWKAGLKAGDKIVAINGESTKGMTLEEASQKMKGKSGTKVTLSIYRDGFDKPKDFVIKRGVVKLKSVKATDLGDGYLYVRLTGFMAKTNRELERVLEKHEKKYKAIKGLIIDLRRNPGGLLDQAVKISDMFLDKGIIVSTKGRKEKQKDVRKARKPGSRLGFPIIVLIDEYSASASEILAGALQDNKRALIMGKRSFGKGSVQSIIKLNDGSALKLTVARYYTPSGRSIQAEGIQPDVEVDSLDPKVFAKAKKHRRVRREKDMRGHLLGEKEKQKQKKKKTFNFWWLSSSKAKEKLSKRDKLLNEDFQVLQAYNYLKAWKVMKNFDRMRQ